MLKLQIIDFDRVVVIIIAGNTACFDNSNVNDVSIDMSMKPKLRPSRPTSLAPTYADVRADTHCRFSFYN